MVADNKKVLVGAVDCTDSGNSEVSRVWQSITWLMLLWQVCKKYVDKGYPTLLHFKYGTLVGPYAGERETSAFRDFLLDPMAGSFGTEEL